MVALMAADVCGVLCVQAFRPGAGSSGLELDEGGEGAGANIDLPQHYLTSGEYEPQGPAFQYV